MDGIAVMTDGPNGAMVSDGESIFSVGTYKEKRVADRTGAGDAFGSGFVAGLMRHHERAGKIAPEFSEKAIEYAIKLASANATSVVESIGAEAGILKRTDFESERRFKNLKMQIKST